MKKWMVPLIALVAVRGKFGFLRQRYGIYY